MLCACSNWGLCLQIFLPNTWKRLHAIFSTLNQTGPWFIMAGPSTERFLVISSQPMQRAWSPYFLFFSFFSFLVFYYLLHCPSFPSILFSISLLFYYIFILILLFKFPYMFFPFSFPSFFLCVLVCLPRIAWKNDFMLWMCLVFI